MTDTITMPREELQAALDALEFDGFTPEDSTHRKMVTSAIQTLRARLAQPCQLSVSDIYAHRLALMLECALLNPNGVWNEAHELLNEYRAAVCKEHEAAGELYVSGFGKD